ncbi:sigma factor-like helix-turn-helix DNA-binding protein [Halorussus sp. AFM4]|uniref:sigma factor-like helix-turn-helix DNA-binding protein n=1 Tax=Halorussus sp. AFM4 TaxID=3421651 RepID=UPI003EC07064
MSDEDKARIVMKRALNKSQRDIAEEVGCTKGTVNRYLGNVKREAEEHGDEETFIKHIKPLFEIDITLRGSQERP